MQVADITGGKRMWKPVASDVFKRRRILGSLRRRTFVLALILGGDVAARLMHTHSHVRKMAGHAGELRRHTETHDSFTHGFSSNVFIYDSKQPYNGHGCDVEYTVGRGWTGQGAGSQCSGRPAQTEPDNASMRNGSRDVFNEMGYQANFRKQKHLKGHEQKSRQFLFFKVAEESSHDPLVSATESQPFLSAMARGGGQGGGREVDI